MKLKLGYMNTKQILNGIFITCLSFIIINFVSFFNDVLIPAGTSGDSILVKIDSILLIISYISTPILLLILLKFILELIYKIKK